MNIAVCEDTRIHREALCAYIQSYCDEHCYQCEISAFESGEPLLEAFPSGAFDLIFLDIYMPGMTGVEAAQKIREADRDCLLVFITTSEDFAMEGFLVQASGYVVKPISSEKMAGVMHACRHVFEQNSRAIEISQGSGNILISIADLFYVEVRNKESVFHMKRGNVAARLALDTVEARLGGSPFLRCHRSYIVNMNYIENIREEDFLMRDGSVVPIRVHGGKEVRMAFAGFKARSPMEV